MSTDQNNAPLSGPDKLNLSMRELFGGCKDLSKVLGTELFDPERNTGPAR